MTLILTGSGVGGLLDTDEMFRALRSGFLAQAQAPAPGLRVRADLPGAESLPRQDLAAAWIAYQAASAHGRGLAVDLLA